MDNFSITQDGKALKKSLYTIDLDTKTFSSKEYDLVLEFSTCDRWTFKTGGSCTFKTGWYCTFKTGKHCTFDTASGCTFHTGEWCTFHTGEWCTFDTGRHCTFTTGAYCTFNTSHYCTFDTGKSCTLALYNINTCKFKKYDGISIILDRKDNKHYLLNEEFIILQKVLNG